MRGNEGVVLVAGGGVMGVKTAIDVASRGFAVYLLDEPNNIEGFMSELNKIFRTNDCPACVVEPKVAAVGEDAQKERTHKDFCSRCRIAAPDANTSPLNKR